MNAKDRFFMKLEQLRFLLTQEESATIDFKRKPYLIDHRDNKIKSRQRDELIKDVLALANGNSIVAGDKAFLIIGADDKRDENGARLLYDVGENSLTTQRILDIINPACSPKLEDLDTDLIEIDGKLLNVITIHPSPHLYETTRKLEPSTAKGTFTEYAVFVRHNESIHVASGKERDAIAKLKNLRFSEIKNPPAAPFGAVVGATIGAISLGAVAEKILDKKEGAQAAGIVGGALFGGSVGFAMGGSFRDLNEIRSSWQRIGPKQRISVALFMSAYGAILWAMYRWLTKKKKG